MGPLRAKLPKWIALEVKRQAVTTARYERMVRRASKILSEQRAELRAIKKELALLRRPFTTALRGMNEHARREMGAPAL